MTRRTNARIAGLAFLLYIALGITAIVLLRTATAGESIAEQLASAAGHEGAFRLSAVLTLICCFAALILGVTLYAITRDQDPDLAMLALTCRAAEGIIGAASLQISLGTLWLATLTGADAPPREAAHAIGAFLQGQEWSPILCAIFFAVGSTLFSWLLLRGRMIPTALAWIGVVASVLLVVGLPLRVAGVLSEVIVRYLWGPMALFEIVLASWFLIKGVGPPRPLPVEAR